MLTNSYMGISSGCLLLQKRFFLNLLELVKYRDGGAYSELGGGGGGDLHKIIILCIFFWLEIRGL